MTSVLFLLKTIGHAVVQKIPLKELETLMEQLN